MPERRLHPAVSQWILLSLTRLFATYAILQGAAIIVGGRDRWRGPSFATALEVPGAPESWGWALGVFGAVALYGTFRSLMATTALAMFLVGVWSTFFAGSFVVSLFRVENAATSGIFTYGCMAVTSYVLAVGYWQSRAGR